MTADDFASSLELLSSSVGEAAKFFAQADEQLCAGSQTARQCLSHLVFWHREYVSILRARREDHPAELRTGTFLSLNAEASREFATVPLSELASQLESLQRELERLLRAAPDPAAKISLRQASHPWPLVELVPRVAAHIQGHTRKFKAAQRRRQQA